MSKLPVRIARATSIHASKNMPNIKRRRDPKTI